MARKLERRSALLMRRAVLRSFARRVHPKATNVEVTQQEKNRPVINEIVAFLNR